MPGPEEFIAVAIERKLLELDTPTRHGHCN